MQLALDYPICESDIHKHLVLQKKATDVKREIGFEGSYNNPVVKEYMNDKPRIINWIKERTIPLVKTTIGYVGLYDPSHKLNKERGYDGPFVAVVSDLSEYLRGYGVT